MQLRTLLHSRNSQLLSFQSLPHSLRKTPGGGGATALPPIFRIFFQVPYALTPVLLTLTKSAGVYGLSSQSGNPLAASSIFAFRFSVFEFRLVIFHFPISTAREGGLSMTRRGRRV